MIYTGGRVMKTLKLSMIGFGNAGRAFSRILINKHEEIKDKYGVNILITAIATATRGNIVDENGIDLRKALIDIDENGFFDKNWIAVKSISTDEIIKTADYDILMEITPLNIFTGQPAIDNIKLAFNRGKHVITANKGPIAWAYSELKELSGANGAHFLYETTVMDGTPVFNLVEQTMPMCKILEFNGILNTTTNFALEEMSKGRTLEQALEEGKRRGFVEADARLDIEGYDAAAKTAALINVLMDGGITPEAVQREGIQHITIEDINSASTENKLIKLVCRGGLENGKIIGEVKPVKLDKKHIFSSIDGTSSILTLRTDLMGEVSIVEHSPEIDQTGYGLFSDLITLIKKII
jgi:homoserine dehydrogenase